MPCHSHQYLHLYVFLFTYLLLNSSRTHQRSRSARYKQLFLFNISSNSNYDVDFLSLKFQTEASFFSVSWPDFFLFIQKTSETQHLPKIIFELPCWKNSIPLSLFFFSLYVTQFFIKALTLPSFLGTNSGPHTFLTIPVPWSRVVV